MNREQRSSTTQQPITTAQVIELWGDGPIFPGPGWRLSWTLAAAPKQRLNASLLSGQLWCALQTNFPDLAQLPEPWQTSTLSRDHPSTLALKAITALADALLKPARLEIQQPHVALELRTACLALRSDQHELAGNALQVAAAIVMAGYLTQQGARFNQARLQRALTDLMLKVRICCGHALTTAQLAEAHRRSIPIFLIDPTQRLYQLGTGIYSRWISSTSNDHDSHFGVHIAGNKSKTHDLLRQLGLPVPREVRLPHNVSNKQLIAAANHIGFPCAIKPNQAEQGRGATAQVSSEQELLDAAQKAKQHSQDLLLLQEHLQGHDYRLNVVNGKLRFVVRRSAPTVVGDGRSTVLELIENHNFLKQQLRLEDGVSTEVNLDDPETLVQLKKAEASFSTVLREGQSLQLRRISNISAGGLHQEIDLNSVHPRIRSWAELISRTFRLDICGIDYISQDISKDPDSCKGAFIEVNSMPQNAPGRAQMIIDNIFPDPNKSSAECDVIIAEWSKAKEKSLANRLIEEIECNCQAIITFPKQLAPTLLPVLSRSTNVEARIHEHEHPREALLHKTARYLIYLTTPDMVMGRGLPVALPKRILLWHQWQLPQEQRLWKELLDRNRHEQRQLQSEFLHRL